MKKIKVEALKKVNHPLLFFVYKNEDRDVFRGVCFPFFITIERDSTEEAKQGIIERFCDFLDIAEKNNIDINKMRQTPEYELDFLIAKDISSIIGQFEKELIKNAREEMEKKISKEKSIFEKIIYPFKKCKPHRKPIWSEVGDPSTMFTPSLC